MKLKPYPKYKDSGIQWIGEIPEGWEVNKIKHYKKDIKFSIVDGPFGTQLHSEEYVEKGIPVIRVINLTYDGKFTPENIVFIKKEKYNELKRSSIKEEDILIAKTGATIGKIGLFRGFEKAIISSSCLKLSLKDEINHNFFKYLLISDSGQSQIISAASGSTRDTINIDPFSNLYFAIPNKINEQKRIANFLDKKTAKIDALIEKDKKLIMLLKEKRNALINHAVTKGLNPNAKFKDSGIPWIGEILKGWEINKIKNTSYVKGRIGWHGLTSEEYSDKGAYLVTGVDFKDGVIEWEDCHHVGWDRYKEDPYIHLKEDDLLITKDGTIGKVALIKSLPDKATLNSGIFLVRPLN